MSFVGSFATSTVVDFNFTTIGITGAPQTLSGSPAISVYKSNSSSPSTAGVALTADFNSTTGLNHVRVDTSADGTFYATGNEFSVVITTGTVGGVSVVGYVVGNFVLNNAPAGSLTAAQIATGVWQDTTSGDFTVASSIGKSLYTSGNVPGAANGLFIAGSNAATTVNFTGNLSGSVGSVTGAVGSVTGNVGGNVVGSVGSISGVTFPPNFSSLSISGTGLVSITSNLKKNQALNNYEFQMVDATTFLPKTGLTVTGVVSLDGASYTALTNSVSEVSNGTYKINLAAGDMNANVVNLKFTATGAAQVNNIIVTQP